MQWSAVLVVLTLATFTKALPPVIEQLPIKFPSAVLSSSEDAVKPLLDLHRELVEIESISGNEYEVGKYVVSYLESIGLTVEIQAVAPYAISGSSTATAAPWMIHRRINAGKDEWTASTFPSRFNIYAYPGTDRSVHTVLSSHLDTVPPYIPYSLTDGVISGRGTVDAKGCVAAMLTAFTSLKPAASMNDHAPPSLGLLFVVGEERGGDGMRQASDTLNTTFKSVIFGEPTEGALACGHKGFMSLDIYVKGKPAHSGYPWLGVSAIEMLVAALDAMLATDLPANDKYGPTTANIGHIEGGLANNVVAAEAKASVAFRLAGGVPSELQAKLTRAMTEATERFSEKGAVLDLQWGPRSSGPVYIDCEVEGWDGGTITVNYGTDIPWLAGNHKRYLYGPGTILVAHSDHEALTVTELEKAVEQYKKIVYATAED